MTALRCVVSFSLTFCVRQTGWHHAFRYISRAVVKARDEPTHGLAHTKGERERDDASQRPVMCTPWLEDGYIYGVCSYGQLRASKQRPASAFGKRFKRRPAPTVRWANAFIVKNGARFFLANEKGELIIAKFSPKGYEEISRTHLLEPTNTAAGACGFGRIPRLPTGHLRKDDKESFAPRWQRKMRRTIHPAQLHQQILSPRLATCTRFRHQRRRTARKSVVCIFIASSVSSLSPFATSCRRSRRRRDQARIGAPICAGTAGRPSRRLDLRAARSGGHRQLPRHAFNSKITARFASWSTGLTLTNRMKSVLPSSISTEISWPTRIP